MEKKLTAFQEFERTFIDHPYSGREEIEGFAALKARLREICNIPFAPEAVAELREEIEGNHEWVEQGTD